MEKERQKERSVSEHVFAVLLWSSDFNAIYICAEKKNSKTFFGRSTKSISGLPLIFHVTRQNYDYRNIYHIFEN
jgi:hypothetical protein